MTYSVACKDVSMQECGFVAKGKSEQEVETEMTKHAQKAHAEWLKSLPRDQAAQMDRLIARRVKTS